MLVSLIMSVILLWESPESSLIKINDGSEHYFKIEKSYLNPMSNPENVFTTINIPDTVDTIIEIKDLNGNTFFTQTYNKLTIGEYQFSLRYTVSEILKPGRYNLYFKAYKDSILKYYASIDIILL